MDPFPHSLQVAPVSLCRFLRHRTSPQRRRTSLRTTRRTLRLELKRPSVSRSSSTRALAPQDQPCLKNPNVRLSYFLVPQVVPGPFKSLATCVTPTNHANRFVHHGALVSSRRRSVFSWVTESLGAWVVRTKHVELGAEISSQRA